ncbi:acyl carrier protein [Streptomyces sp. SL13]|uniref:Acyl carrier protein n=1 Tax=Streptantibioticus silvisoli TaxID=2705255 RepID=A0AA90K9L0_9ACTN|nr:acyl carrier protein [Streptantibioticus silvisoli]MDI5961188.1 acyl carrier protein [Streptantibioticus silvisoli]MDI5970992.1 acyl carrier protein [Streptantibioticus silvisoli]
MREAPWPPEFEKLLRANLPLLDADAPLDPGLNLADHGLDSLATVGLLMDLEELLGVTIPDELLEQTSFQDPLAVWQLMASAAGDGAAPA